MKRILIIMIGLFLLISCEEQVAKFIFDSSKMSQITRYTYDYNSKRLISSNEKTYTVMFGKIVDTLVSSTNYEYKGNGLLIKKISKYGFNDPPSLQFFDYNLNDSLIREITISPEKDTTLWIEYEYFSDGKKIVFNRVLHRHFDANQDFLKQMVNRKFDTILYRIDYQYENNLCTSSKEYDKKNNLTKIIQYDYENGKIKKATHIFKINSLELTDKEQYFNYSNSEFTPDYYSIDINKDTLEYCKNEFYKHSNSLRKEVFNYGKIVNKTFFENGKEIGYISFDKSTNFKIVESYSYYENGDLKETKSYHEKINATL